MKKMTRILASFLLFAILMTCAPAISLPVSATNAKNDYDFTGLYLTREQITLKTGGSFTLVPREIGLSDGSITWSSLDESIATVTPSGEVFGLKVGKTTVIAEKDGYVASCAVLVGEKDPAIEEYEHTMELVQDFLDLRFGMFLHFNSATYEFASVGGDWGGESYQSTFRPTQWNPSELDCRSWAAAAKSAGMTFAVLTTKHHDGFDLWDSAYTDYDVGAARLKTDVVEKFVEGCRAEGILPGLYFSMLDVKHKITSSDCTDSDVEFIKAQLRELLTGYGEIPFLIFDGWNAYWGGPHYAELPYEEIVNLVHTYQPDCLVINISCEANNSHSQIAMFESAAGQEVPDWFDNVNISCNTPTAHWFWCDFYETSDFKDVDWVLNQNVNPFTESNTVFILNCSPNKQGVLIDAYKNLLADIGKGYEKPADTVELPERWAADYDYHNNLLFHKEAIQSSTDSEGSSSNAPAIRAVDGYTDADYDHSTASRTNSELEPWWMADIGYSAELGKLIVYTGTSGKTGARYATVFISEKPFDTDTMSFDSLSADPDVTAFKLTEGVRVEDCYTLDLGGLTGRYVCIMLSPRGQLSLAEVILNPKGVEDDRVVGMREGIDGISVAAGTAGTDLPLPQSAYFITADGSPVEKTLNWSYEGYNPDVSGSYLLTATPEGSDFIVEATVTVNAPMSASGGFTQIPVSNVTASSYWGDGNPSGWAGIGHLASGDGLTVCEDNILLSTHDNPYNATTMWHSADGKTTATLTFDLGTVQTVTNLLIWNHNQLDLTNRGVKEMEVFISASDDPADDDWTSLGRFTLSKASGSENEPASDLLTLGRVEARYFRFDLLSTYGSTTNIGMSEVVFLKAAGENDAEIRLSTLISSFELLSVYDYPADSFASALALRDQAASALAEGLSEEAAEVRYNDLTAALEELKSVQTTATVSGLDNLTWELSVGAESLPETLPLSVNGQQVEAGVVWNRYPAEMLSTKGSYTVRGRISNTPYQVTLSLAVRGISSDALSALVSEYGTLSTDGYTADSVAAFEAALSDAKAVLDKTDATQSEIDLAKSALKHAKYHLIPAVYLDSTVEVPTDSDQATAPADPANPGDSKSPLPWVLGGAAVLILLAVVAGVLIGRKKKSN
ncbi:MAG: alpha-L-fucosidase [Eubacteriales bacterium]